MKSYPKRRNISPWRIFWLDQHAKQRAWIQSCGGDLAGYIEKYHHKHGRTLENTKAIYDADLAELQRIEEKLKSYPPQSLG